MLSQLWMASLEQIRDCQERQQYQVRLALQSLHDLRVQRQRCIAQMNALLLSFHINFTSVQCCGIATRKSLCSFHGE